MKRGWEKEKEGGRKGERRLGTRPLEKDQKGRAVASILCGQAAEHGLLSCITQLLACSVSLCRSLFFRGREEEGMEGGI